MKIEVTDDELALCIGALELGAKELREGLAASGRLNMPMPDGMIELAAQMESLKARLLADGQEAKD